MEESEYVPIFCKYESVLRTYHYYLKKGLPVLMSKSVSGESLLESLGSSEGETFGFVPTDRGGEFGAAGAGLVETF